MYFADTFIETGSLHKVCEDYIIKGNTPEQYIILSDGCSSSENTEMGARVLCHLAKQFLRYYSDSLTDINYKRAGEWIIHNAEMAVRILGLNKSCLDATLIIMIHIENQIHIMMYGDGVVFTKKDEKIKMYKIDFSKNAPYYLSYLIDYDKQNTYHESKIDKIVTIIDDFTGEKVTEISQEAYDYPSIFSFKTDDVDSVMICSDGVSSFIKTSTPELLSVDTTEIVKSMFAFKQIQGEYLKRRLNRLMKNLNKDNIFHYDDLSVGSFVKR